MAFLTRLANLVASQIPTPATAPPSGSNVLYPKSDGVWYTLGSDGIERRVGGGVLPQPNVQIFSAAGSFTWTKPSGAKTVVIEVLGAGGAGGGSGVANASQNSRGSGGGAGGFARRQMAATDLPSTVPVTVGAGGVGNLAADGSAGGGSSFGTYVVAGGGAGGTYLASNGVDFWVAGGDGGTATVGDVLIPGQPGMPSNGNGVLGMGGAGGSTDYGAGGKSAQAASAAQAVFGNAATGYGAGGGGALATAVISAGNRSGGNGAPGLVIVTTYFDTDASSTGTVATDTANLVTNPSFEVLNTDGTINGWSNYWAINTPVHSVETDITNVYNGTKAAKVVLDQDDTGRYGSNTFAVAEGEIVTVRARVKTTSTAGLEAAFMFFTSGPTDPAPGFFASGSTQQSYNWVQVASDGYFLAETTFVIPAGDTKGHLEVQLANPASRAAGTITAWVDSVMVLPEMNPTGKAAIVRDPPGVIKEYAGFTAPSGYLLCDGTSYNRTDYPYLWDALTYKLTASGTSGQTSITTSAIGPATMGMEITGPGVPPGTTITGIAVATNYTIGLSNALTATSTNAEFRLAPYGVAATTTFKVPDRRGRVGVGVDSTSEFAFLGYGYGEKTHTLTAAEMPAHTHTDPSHSHGFTFNNPATTATGGTAIRVSNITATGQPQATSTAAAGGGQTGSAGGGGAHNNVQPSMALNYIIKT